VESEKIEIEHDFIKLDQLLKLVNIADSGGMVKFLIKAGKVFVNEEIELRRGRKLIPGDCVQVELKEFLIEKVR